jgi:hypothetical protein
MKRPTAAQNWKYRAYFTSMDAAIKFMCLCEQSPKMFPFFGYYCPGGAVVVWD